MCTYYKVKARVVHVTENVVESYDKTGPWTWANLITCLRIVGMVAGFALYLQGHPRLGVEILVLAAATDWLDGWVARRFEQTSRFGATLDPIVDKSFMLFAIVFTGIWLWPISHGGIVSLVAITCMEAAIARRAYMHWRQTDAFLKVVRMGKLGIFFRMPSVLILLWATTVDTGLAQDLTVVLGSSTALVGIIFGFMALDQYALGASTAKHDASK